MTTERDKLDNEMFGLICGLLYKHGDHLGRADWQKIFKDALDNAFPDHPEDAGDLSA